MSNELNPDFKDQDNLLNPEMFKNHANDLLKQSEAIPHKEILKHLLQKVEPIDFRKLAELEEDGKLKGSHFRIKSVEEILTLARVNNWGICQYHDFFYLFNGTHWSLFDAAELRSFLGEAAEKMGVHWDKARDVDFRKKLFEQFKEIGNLPKPEQTKGKVLINLQNGTFEVTPKGNVLREFRREDFLTYQLPFEYNPDAKAPIFTAYLNKVLPDIERQKVLAEYLGFVFLPHGTIKLEKVLLLYGSGANGKSVFYEIVKALLGNENISEYSLQSLTDIERGGPYRAMIANKLVNYASEINGKLESSLFKAMASGEPIEAKALYSQPFIVENYAKLIFNCNELPKEVEQTDGFFRRWLIIPFDVTIPESQQDKQLTYKIISNELSGVFNWVLDGLNLLIQQQNFTQCEAVQRQVDQYKRQSDSVQMFLEDAMYIPDANEYILVKTLYEEYKQYCLEDGFKPVNKTNFKRRMTGAKINIHLKNVGWVAYLKKVGI